MTVSINLRTIVAFAAGLGVAFAAVLVFHAWRVDAAPGDFDATFVPITPCRLIDTRPGDDRVGSHASFGDQATKTVMAHGSNGKCSIPPDATGLSLNVTAVNATAPSFLTIWPEGALPKASSLNPAPGQPPGPNAVATPLAANGSFKVYNKAGSVDVIVDVNGYYSKASLQDMAARLAELERSRPFAVTNHMTNFVHLTANPSIAVSVTVAAPVAGRVTVDSTTNVTHTVDGGEVLCAIYESSAVPPGAILSNEPSFQRWETGGLGDAGSLAGSRTFEIASGATIHYSLACQEAGNGGTLITRSLTAIFTPAP